MVTESARRRQEVIHAVWYLAATRGFEAVTFRNVAQDAGVSVGAVQHHFGSREELIRAGCREMVTTAETALPASKDPAETLRHILMAPIPDTDTSRVGIAIWYAYRAKSLDDAEIAAVIIEAERGRQELVATLLAGLGVPDASSRAWRLLATADGLSTQVMVRVLGAAQARTLIDAALDETLARAEVPPGAK